ncbi:hypothetical protein PEC311524_01160 [Pectobacterium carotovorum subsp. carotovorum]|nr:hypothetical protein PEC311524_01160 [Pectobacterium carotovorum subsp. carotovorum]
MNIVFAGLLSIHDSIKFAGVIMPVGLIAIESRFLIVGFYLLTQNVQRLFRMGRVQKSMGETRVSGCYFYPETFYASRSD